MERNATKTLRALFLFLCMTTSMQVRGQATITFSGTSTRNGKIVSPSAFLDVQSPADIPKDENQNCFAGVGWLRFKVVETGRVDSLEVAGDILPNFKNYFVKRVVQSAKFWSCKDCQKGGYWIIVPVLTSFTLSCKSEQQFKSSNAAIEFYRKLFNSWVPLNDLEGISLGERSYILKPLYYFQYK